MSNTKNIGTVVLKRVLIAALTLLAILSAHLISVSAQETIEDAQDQREQTKEEQLRAKAEFESIDAEYEDFEVAYKAASELVELAQNRATAVETRLEVAQHQLRRSEISLEWAAYDREIISKELTDIAVAQYLGIHQDQSENLLNSADLTATMRKKVVMDAVQGVGHDIFDDARIAASKHKDLHEQVESELEYVDQLKKSVAAEQDRVESALAIRSKAKAALDEQRSFWAGRIDDLEAEETRLTEFIRSEQRKEELAKAAREAAEAARAAEAAGKKAEAEAARARASSLAAASSQGYIWPTAGGIGSYFGPRKHPVLGYTRLHGGIDIGGRMGQPIYAARAGKVIMARRNGGYGNCIVIDHGGDVATLYAHQSTFVVSNGAIVTQGQHIGNVGSTGLSTGPHLHFEVRIDGSVVDPLPFLPPR